MPRVDTQRERVGEHRKEHAPLAAAGHVSASNDPARPLAAQRRRNAEILAQAHAIASAAREETTLLGIVPMHEREVTELPAGARMRFLARLRGRLTEAFATAREVPAIDRTAPAATGLPAQVMGTACGLCGGACCTRGGEHAFLGVDSLARVRAENPEHSDASLLEAYASHLPTHHFRDSCVYHGAHGCVLPRALRSTTCNRYNCGGLTQILRAVDAIPSPARTTTRVVIGVSDNVALRRLVRVDEHDVQEIAIGRAPAYAAGATPAIADASR